MANKILVINSGSSSIKFSLIDAEGRVVICSGLAEKLGIEGACLHTSLSAQKQTIPLPGGNHDLAMKAIFSFLERHNFLRILTAVGHRVVHGGEFFKASTLINEEVIGAIERCVPFAP